MTQNTSNSSEQASPADHVFIDTHCHMCNGGFNNDRDEAYTRAHAAGVKIIVNIGTDPENWQTYVDDAKQRNTVLPDAEDNDTVRENKVFVGLGIHPNHADTYSEDSMRLLKSLLRDNSHSVALLGEIGLDTFRDYCPIKTQETAFLAQLELAATLELPYAIHCRSEEDRMLGCIQETGNTRGLWHCFSGNTDMMRRALDLNLYIGIGGVSTYKSARDLKEAIRFAPRDRVVLETDAPYLAPTPHRGKRNEPAYVVETAKNIADIWEQPLAEVSRILAKNSSRCLPSLRSAVDGHFLSPNLLGI